MIYVISGMVRAGTSMMAEMLKQGGIKLLYDPDIPNTDPTDDFPHNTFWLSDQTRLAQHPEQLVGHAIKMMSSAVLEIPKGWRSRTRVVWMRRSLRQVHASLRLADERRGNKRGLPSIDVSKRIEKFYRKWIIEAGFPLLAVSYKKVVKHPKRETRRVVKFLEYSNFDLDAAVAVVDPTKWRQR